MIDNNNELAINSFKTNYPIYENFTRDIKNLVEKVLLFKNIKYDHIEARTKSLESFSEKIGRDGKDYEDPIHEVTDISGVRIVVFSLNDIEKVSSIIEDVFFVDYEKSVNKSEKLKINEFGYLSKHLIVSLKDDRLKLLENENYKDLKAEIQIRTVLQHAWATIEHKINYKHNIKLPDEQQRDFYRLSAVLELADKEFQSAIEAYDKTIEGYKTEIGNNNISSIDLNSDSIKFYLDSDEIKQKLADFKSIDRLYISFEMSALPTKQFFYLLKVAKIESLQQLAKIIDTADMKKNMQNLVNVWKQDKQDDNLKLVVSRLTFLRLLVYFTASEDEKREIIEKKLLSDAMINLVSQLEKKKT